MDMNKNNLKYRGMYLFTYAPIGIICPLIGQYLSSIGFSGTQIGTVTAVSTAVAIFASTFWGKMYSNSRQGKYVVMMLCFCAGLTAMACSLIESFILFTIMYGVLYFFQGPVMGLTDAMVLSDENTDANFSSFRLFGSVGYAVFTFIASKVGETAGLDKIFPMYLAAFAIGGLIVASVKQTSKTPKTAKTSKALGEARESGGNATSSQWVSGKESGDAREPSGPRASSQTNKVGFGHLRKEPKAIQLIVCGFFIFGSNVANNTYFGFLVTDGGGSVAIIGTIFLLMVCSEAPFMALTTKLNKVISPQKLIAFAILVAILRFGWYATGPSYVALIVMFFLQGIVNGILLVEYVRYISLVVDEKLIGIAVSLFYAVSSNGGTIVCTFFGGAIMDHLGVTGVYGFFAIMNAIGLIIFFLFGLNKSPQRQSRETQKVDNNQF